MLPDGRANVLVEGMERFALARVVTGETLYHQADVLPWADLDGDDPPALVHVLEAGVREAFGRVANAARTIADDSDPVPQLPDDPSALSFTIAAAVELPLPARQRLLASRSCAERLRELQALLGAVDPEIETRAAVHLGAKTNGHGPHGTDRPTSRDRLVGSARRAGSRRSTRRRTLARQTLARIVGEQRVL